MSAVVAGEVWTTNDITISWTIVPTSSNTCGSSRTVEVQRRGVAEVVVGAEGEGEADSMPDRRQRRPVGKLGWSTGQRAEAKVVGVDGWVVREESLSADKATMLGWSHASHRPR